MALLQSLDMDVALRVGVLGRIRQEIGNALAEPCRIPIDPQHAVAGNRELVALVPREWRNGLNGLLDNLRELQDFALQYDVTERDAGNVEQIVHEAREVVRLPVDDRDRLCREFRVGSAS